MFRTAELGRTVDKVEYKERSEVLRDRLLELQYRLRDRREFPVIVDFAGVDGAGKGTTVNLLHSWLDARALMTNAYGPRTEPERNRPPFWRYWRDLPPKGGIAFNLSGRYSEPFLERVRERIDDAEFRLRLDRITAFERALAVDGAIVIKLWMHLSKKAQKKRLKTLEEDPLQSWRVSKQDWAHYAMYDRFIGAAEETIARTDREHAPWHIVEGTDRHYRILAVTQILIDALEARLGSGDEGEAIEELDTTPIDVAALDQLPPRPHGLVTILSELEMPEPMERKDYRQQLAEEQQRLHDLQWKAHQEGVSTVVVFEGPDAAGKGSAIRRVIPALDAKHYRVVQYGAPTDEEKLYHYLWRFWRKIGPVGHLTLFDRSWYGRVLVERVLGFASVSEWKRAYGEINDFEAQLMGDHTAVVKFWLHVTPDEQLRRFEARGTRKHKRWKLTDEDWRNRKDWYAYEEAAHDMVQHTSTRHAPWTIVPANDKHHARVTVVRTIADALQARLDG